MITLTPYQPKYRQSTLKRIEAFGVPSGFGTENRGTAAGRTGASDDAGFGKLDIKGPLAFCHFAG